MPPPIRHAQGRAPELDDELLLLDDELLLLDDELLLEDELLVEDDELLLEDEEPPLPAEPSVTSYAGRKHAATAQGASGARSQSRER